MKMRHNPTHRLAVQQKEYMQWRVRGVQLAIALHSVLLPIAATKCALQLIRFLRFHDNVKSSASFYIKQFKREIYTWNKQETKFLYNLLYASLF